MPKRWLFILMLASLSAFVPLSIDMYLPAFPQIAKDFGVEIGQVQQTLSIYMIGMAMGQVLYGALADRWGRRRLLLWGMMVFTIATAGCALSGSIGALMFWRLGVAVGGSAGIVITRAIVRDSFGITESAQIYGTLMLVLGIVPVLAPFFGGQLLLLTGWRGIFWLIATFAAMSVVTVYRYMPETLPHEHRVQHGVGDILRVYRRLFRTRLYLGYVLSLGCVSAVLFAYIVGSPTLYIEIYGISAQAFGLIFGINTAAMIMAAQANRWLLKHYPQRRILETAYALNLALALVLWLQVVTSWGGFPAAVTVVFLCVGSTGFLFPNLLSLAMGPVGHIAGSASALMGTLQYAVGGLSGAVVGFLYNGTVNPMMGVLVASSFIGYVLLRVMAREAGVSGRVYA